MHSINILRLQRGCTPKNFTDTISGKTSYLSVRAFIITEIDVFDFTNTNKYYEPESLESLGVRHHKF